VVLLGDASTASFTGVNCLFKTLDRFEVLHAHAQTGHSCVAEAHVLKGVGDLGSLCLAILGVHSSHNLLQTLLGHWLVLVWEVFWEGFVKVQPTQCGFADFATERYAYAALQVNNTSVKGHAGLVQATVRPNVTLSAWALVR